VLKVLNKELRSMIAKPSIQEAVQAGLLNWSKFYVGEDFKSVVPGSIQFFEDDDDSGIQYQVNK
jgi:hypothetical protein